MRYRGLSEVEGDFVELPSQIMENWALSPELLRQYAVNYRTGEVMPEEMIERIERSRLFNTGFTTTELVAAALSDMDIHSLTDGEVGDVNAFEREALTVKRGLIPQIAPRYRYPYFSHIFDGGYASGYYFYIWAEVLDKDAFQAFVESGDLLSRDVAERFRREILSRGGSRSGMDMYRAFRGGRSRRQGAASRPRIYRGRTFGRDGYTPTGCGRRGYSCAGTGTGRAVAPRACRGACGRLAGTPARGRLSGGFGPCGRG